MRANEFGGESPLFFHERCFAQLSISANFFILRDAGPVVIAEPQLEREVGAQWDETMEAEIVAGGPGSAAEDDQEQSEDRSRSAQRGMRSRAIPSPAE